MEINARENRITNREWTIQRHWQHWVYKTQRVVKTKHKKHNTEILKETRTPPKTREWTQVLAKGKEFLSKYAMSPHIKILGEKTNRASFYADITTRTENIRTYDMTECGTPLYATNTNIINETWTLLQTSGGKTNGILFSCRNRNGHQNTELRT